MSQLLSIDELNDAADEVAGIDFRRVSLVTVGFVVWSGLGLTATSLLSDGLSPDLSRDLTLTWNCLGMFVLIAWATLHYRKITAVKCPQCTRRLIPHRLLVIATGNCPHCGRRVIKDALHGK